MTPTWLNEIVRDFGRQMGLNEFALNERGTAGLRFENGLSLRLEYANETLTMMIGMTPTNSVDFESFARKLLSLAHYELAGGVGVRAGYLARAGEAIFVKRMNEREIDVPKLEEAFQALWQAAMEMGGRA